MSVQRLEVDVALVGGGGAGLALLHQLALRGPHRLRVAVVDPVDRLTSRPDDRTWCFWDRFGSGGVGDDVAPALTTTWGRAVVRGPGADLDLDLAPLRYALVRAPDFYALVADQVSASTLQVVHVGEPVADVHDGADRARVVTDGTEIAATWVFDSRPATPRRPARTVLVQHFSGRYLRLPEPLLDPDRPVLMDLRTPQPASGVSFGYVLPLAADRALVEYTEFSPPDPDRAGVVAADERGLDAYLALVGIAAGDVVVEHTEDGAIPMTDAGHARRVGRRVFRAGTAGGATRASTGYTFTAVQRQARGVAALLAAGLDPLPPRHYPRRHEVMDALLLRALATGDLSGPGVFTRLFGRNPPARVLALLDGATTPGQELALMATVPTVPMLRALAWLAVGRRGGVPGGADPARSPV